MFFSWRKLFYRECIQEGTNEPYNVTNIQQAFWIPNILLENIELCFSGFVRCVETNDLPLVQYGVQILEKNELYREIILYESSEGMTCEPSQQKRRNSHTQFMIEIILYLECLSKIRNPNINIKKELRLDILFRNLEIPEGFFIVENPSLNRINK